MKRLFLSGLILLAACSSEVGPWKLDSIVTGSKEFDSARLVYADSTSHSRLRLEFLRVNTAVDLFLNLAQFTITPIASSLTETPSALVRLTIGNEPSFEEAVPLLEGRMRLHFPPEMAERITRALQEGHKVAILVDGFEETIDPERFSNLYEKFTGNATFLKNPFKGLTD